MGQNSTRKVSLRSVCKDEATLAAIRFKVDFVATPLRYRLLDFLRHFVVCRTDPAFHCAVCDTKWREQCGLAARRQGLRERADVSPQQHVFHRRVPTIDINLLQESAALITTSTHRRQRQSLLSHFYDAHFAPLLSEDTGGPAIDITAHHQLVHHLLQDVLTNLEQHYRANFPKWVRKYCRAKLEVNDDEVPLGGLAGMALGQPQAGNEGGAETDEEDQVHVTAKARKALAGLMTAALMGWRQLPLTEADLGGLAVPDALLARANATVAPLVAAWTARGIWPIQRGSRGLLQREPLCLPIRRWLATVYERLKTANPPAPPGEVRSANFAMKRAQTYALIIEASSMPLHIPLTNTIIQELLVNHKQLAAAEYAAAGAELLGSNATAVWQAATAAAKHAGGWKAFANVQQAAGAPAHHDAWRDCGFNFDWLKRLERGGGTFAYFMRTDGAAACMLLGVATAADAGA
eukprot:XP_001698822.1 predicted protein [Chlamydomonas reinhardtii]